MKKRTLCFVLMLCFSVVSLSVQDSSAIGKWREGTVTKAPWVDQYTRIQIDNVRYTVMEDAKIVNVYEKKGATYRDKLNLYSILDGHRLVYKNEGNRIYQIEKIR